MKILLDTNVVLDLLLAREPFVEWAREIFVLVENAELEGYLCANSITTLHYLVGREKNKEEADEIVSALLSLFEIASVDKRVLLDATTNNGIDYEDSVIYNSAFHSSIDIIVTRDKKGFKNSKISTLTPQEFLAFWLTKK